MSGISSRGCLPAPSPPSSFEQRWDVRFIREVEDAGDRILATQAIPSAVANAALVATLGGSP